MSYIDIDDLTNLVPEAILQQLTDDNCTGDITTSTVDEVITEACEVVDGYLRGRYSLPFANTPTLVKQQAKQIARYMLYERRPEGCDLPAAVVRGQKDAYKMLGLIRDGQVSIGVAQTGAIQNDDGEFHVRIRKSRNAQSSFSRDVLDRW